LVWLKKKKIPSLDVLHVLNTWLWRIEVS
jgi:hypothetical protein